VTELISGDSVLTEEVAGPKEILNEQDKGQTAALIKKVLKGGAILFHDPAGTGFIAMHGNGNQVLRIRSREFKSWLSNLGWKSLGKPIASSVIETTLRTVEGHAIHEGNKLELYVRAADLEGELWYDLDDGKAVKVTAAGWEVVEWVPILFYRYTHQKPQVVPIKGGSLEEIFSFIPEPQDPNERLLLLVWLATALLQGFAHPILVVKGEKGSRKTTLFKLLRRLLDPSLLETMGPQRDMKEFIQQASHNYFLPLDNLSPINRSFSDLLCRVVTGEGFSKRELFSDDDDVIYSFQRLLGMNGINLPIDKPDILDRSLIISLQPPQHYEDEQALFARFEAARPRLLGSLFDVIARTLKQRQDSPMLEGLEQYRMAGFAQFGTAAAEVLGYKKTAFVEAMEANRQLQHDEVIETSAVAHMVVQFMNSKREWHGTPTMLLKELQATADGLGLDKHTGLPKHSNWLWRKLEEVVPNLREKGIAVTHERGTTGRTIQILKTAGMSQQVDEINVDDIPY
jgi:hypothetical protein